MTAPDNKHREFWLHKAWSMPWTVHDKPTISLMMQFPRLGIKDTVFCGLCGEKIWTAEWEETSYLCFEMKFDPPEINDLIKKKE